MCMCVRTRVGIVPELVLLLLCVYVRAFVCACVCVQRVPFAVSSYPKGRQGSA